MSTDKPFDNNMNKRKNEDVVEAEGSERQRRRTRSSSEPLPNQTEEPEKREALKRLFGRLIVLNTQNNPPQNAVADSDDDNEEDFDDNISDENDDPLLDGIPVNMDPEQLGFLVCAQETLRFLHGRGFSVENPTFVMLRSRLLRGMQHMATA